VSALIHQIGLKCALVPRLPGITSALGCAIADLKHDVVQTMNLMLDGLDAPALERRMRAAGMAANAVIAGAAIPIGRSEVLHELDMHYLGQTHTVAVPVPVGDDIDLTEAAIRSAFEAAYSASFSRLLPGLPVGILSLRVTAIGKRPAFDASVFAPHPSSSLDKARLGRHGGAARRHRLDHGFAGRPLAGEQVLDLVTRQGLEL
jgi:N-methylhydantoinase A